MILALVALALHAALMFGAAPLLAGVVRAAAAGLAGLAPPPVLEPYRALRHRLRQPPVLPDIATPLFPAWPYLALASAGAMALLAPGFALGTLTAPLSGAVTFTGVAVLGRVALAMAAMEAGTASGGAAAIGIATAAAAIPLALLALLGGNAGLGDGGLGTTDAAGRALIGLAVFTLAVAEDRTAGRVHAGRGQYAGPDLAMLDYAAWLRRLAWLSLIASLILPPAPAAAALPLGWPLGLLAWAVKISLLGLGLAAARVWLGPMRPGLRVAAAAGLGLLALVLLAGRAVA